MGGSLCPGWILGCREASRCIFSVFLFVGQKPSETALTSLQGGSPLHPVCCETRSGDRHGTELQPHYCSGHLGSPIATLQGSLAGSESQSCPRLLGVSQRWGRWGASTSFELSLGVEGSSSPRSTTHSTPPLVSCRPIYKPTLHEGRWVRSRYVRPASIIIGCAVSVMELSVRGTIPGVSAITSGSLISKLLMRCVCMYVCMYI